MTIPRLFQHVARVHHNHNLNAETGITGMRNARVKVCSRRIEFGLKRTHPRKVALRSVTGQGYNVNTCVTKTSETLLHEVGSFFSSEAISKKVAAGHFPAVVHGYRYQNENVFGDRRSIVVHTAPTLTKPWNFDPSQTTRFLNAISSNVREQTACRFFSPWH